MTVYCQKCGTQNVDTASFCSSCGASLAAPGGAPVAAPGMLGGAPPTPGYAPAPAESSGKATASLVCGILGLATCQLLGIVAIILGAMAKADIRRSGGRLGGEGFALAGIILGAVSFVVVVPIIAVLAAIAIPNFLEAQTRAKVSRTMSDMRSLATAIEAYAVDNNTYPVRLDQLTTPVSYIASLPHDIFTEAGERGGEKSWLAYAPLNPQTNRGQTRYSSWILSSRGPDGAVTLDLARDLPAGKALKPEELQSLLVPNTYDPTNGTTSAGDIFKYSSGYSF
jgi:type II secretory pathway pseudopilin PulG